MKRLLEKKSCLIVLDDLLDTSEWDLIKPILFPWLEKTSRIIVTTRQENIANHCSGEVGNVHNLRVLEPEDALRLFSEKVISNRSILLGLKTHFASIGKIALLLHKRNQCS